jgi:hypothetical protein
MKSRQDGQGIPPYDAETAREIRKLGPGGHGNFERLSDAEDRGVTPALVAETQIRAARQALAGKKRTGSGGKEPSSREPHSPMTKTEPVGNVTMPDTTEKVREKAYELWILEGRPEGRDLVHWDMARELVAQEDGLDTTLLPIHSGEDDVEDAVAALDNEGEAPGLIDQGKDDSDALRAIPSLNATSPSPVETSPPKRKAGRPKP